MDSTVSSVTPSIMAQGNTPSEQDHLIYTTTITETRSGSPRPAVGQTSKRFQKLCETFGNTRFGEKLRLGRNNPQQQQQQQSKSAQSTSSSSSSSLLLSESSAASSSSDNLLPPPSKRRIKSGKIRPFNFKESTIDEESYSDLDFESSSVDQKDSGVDPGDQEEQHVQTAPISLKGSGGISGRLSHSQKGEVGGGDGSSGSSAGSDSGGHHHHTRYVLEVDEDLISAGFPSDLPSGLIDIEGNFIGEFDFRFGLEDDDDFESMDCDNYFQNSVDNNNKRGKSRKKKVKSSDNNNPLIKKSSSVISNQSNNSVGRDSTNIRICNSPSKLLNMTETKNGDLKNYCNSNSQSNNSSITVPGDNMMDEITNSPEKVNSTPLRTFVHRRRSRSPHAPVDRHHSSGATSNTSSTITQHYYPEAGWGFVILVTATFCHSLLCGMQLAFGILMRPIFNKFGEDLVSPAGWLGALSLGISLFFSPVWVSICKRKSTRLSAVFGGLVASLGCLFTSFASQFHQLFFSYGAFVGVGVGLTRDASTLMVGQYFKRKREMVEIVVVAGSGLGIILMSVSIHFAVTSLGWRLGLQTITGSLFITFFLSTCYRSASLYHPQRRAILHLKNQKRKVKEKEKREEKPPFIDYSCLRSKTLQILLLSSAFISFGLYNPLFSLAVECGRKGVEGCSPVLLHVYMGAAWILGCLFFGLLVIQKSPDCRVSKQYLTQVASVICGISILTLTSVKGNSGMMIFSWVYGFSLGGYNYALKVYTYERVRARHFPRAWSFVQSVQAIPLLFGVPLTGEINQAMGWKYGYLLSAISIFIGAACLFLTDVRRRKLSRRKANSQNSSMKTCETTDGATQSPKPKRLSFSFPVEQPQPPNNSKHDSDDENDPGGEVDPNSGLMKELTCISEEGLADMDFQGIYYDEWAEYFGECITSCNKVENCLASEYDHDYAVLVERRARRWSAARQTNPTTPPTTLDLPVLGGTGRKVKTTKSSTVLGVPMLNPKLFKKINLGNRSQQNVSSSRESSSQQKSQLEKSPNNNSRESTSGSRERGELGSNSSQQDELSSPGAIDEDSV